MIVKVVKRDGRKQGYDGVKVIKAAEAALIAAGYSQARAYEQACEVNEIVSGTFDDNEVVTVSDIHRKVEDSMMDLGLKDAARAYIEYRKTRDNIREGKGKLVSDINGFLDQSAEEFTRENANKPSTVVNTHRDLLAGILSKHVALTQILPKSLSEWHTDGFGHIHDLDYQS